ncbi:MAG: Unknown protein [uncultured Sulfurovum sp.]|uniref:Uncharacterized protein n=1 Tax=uncultured Sulfurovum sp. TaxID=269237 RepID=A0A6S6T7V5_9BACT|nr:MAG: Unknown protein [uncultured Sulfurovum sp.]
MSNSKLYTFWLPMVDFTEMHHKLNDEEIKRLLEKLKKIKFTSNPRKVTLRDFEYHRIEFYKKFKVESGTHLIKFDYSGQSIIIDSMGFFYIETNEETYKEVFEFIIKILSEKTKEFIKFTFLNDDIACMEKIEDDEKEVFYNFLNSIKTTFPNIENIILQTIEYRLFHKNQNEENSSIQKFKLTLKEKAFNNNEITDFSNIINRNIVNLVEKSLFYTHGLHYEQGEIYDLKIFSNPVIDELVEHFSLELHSINYTPTQLAKEKKEILTSVIKKAIQDTIEEETLLVFLKQTKNEYLTKVFDKISEVNKSIENLHSQILAIENLKDENNSKCSTNSEEEIEIFIQKLLQVIPKFKIIDTKIKNAYYIKVGNITTSTQMLKSELIENTLFYEKWKSAISYFEDMAIEIKEVLIIYHQNKSIKELENIAYYENYKSDLEDIKDIQENKDLLTANTRSYIDTIVLVIATTALAGEAPIFQLEDTKKLVELKASSLFPSVWNAGEIFVNIVIYASLLGLIYFFFIKIKGWKKIGKFFKSIWTNLIKSLINKFMSTWSFNKSKENSAMSYYHFENSDYDKHEHRSSKPIYTYNDNNQENKKKEALSITYNEIYSAYILMKRLKEKSVSKHINGESQNYPLFPHILKNIYTYKEPVRVRENYRISRTDKMNIKILYRYKITELELKTFLEEIQKDKDFIAYYSQVVYQEKNDALKTVNEMRQELKEAIEEIKLNLYVVYSFNLKFKARNKAKYTYTVMKDQFRVHYHINKLPYTKDSENQVEPLQQKIAELIYIYFLARLKNFDYLDN